MQQAPLPKGGWIFAKQKDWGILLMFYVSDIYPSTAYAVPLPLGEGGFYFRFIKRGTEMGIATKRLMAQRAAASR